MKKAIKYILLSILVIIFIGALGCKKEGAGTKTKLSMFVYRDVTSPEAAHWDIILEAFYSLYPNIELESEEAFNEPYHTKLQAMAVAGQLPDVLFLWPGKRTGQVTSQGLVKDLRPWIKGHEDEFMPIAVSAQGPNGEIYELPEQVTATHVMYANDKLMKELGIPFPKTLDELIAQGDKIRAAGLIPISMANKDGWQMQSCLLSTLTERSGGLEWFDKAVHGKGAGFGDAPFVNALNIIKTLYENNMFSPGVNQAEYARGTQDFTNEKAVYYIDGSWKVNDYIRTLTDEQKTYITLHTFPNIPDQKGISDSTSAVPGTGYGMSAELKGARAEAAWSWIWFYAGPIGSRIRQGIGAIPAYKLTVPPQLDPMIKKLIVFLNEKPMSYVIDNKMDAEGMGFLQTSLQEMMFGNKTPKEVADSYEKWVAENDTTRKLK